LGEVLRVKICKQKKKKKNNLLRGVLYHDTENGPVTFSSQTKRDRGRKERVTGEKGYKLHRVILMSAGLRGEAEGMVQEWQILAKDSYATTATNSNE